MILAVFGVVIATMTISTCNCAGVGGTGEGQLERTCNAPIGKYCRGISHLRGNQRSPEFKLKPQSRTLGNLKIYIFV